MKKYTLFYGMFPILMAVLVGCTTPKAKTTDRTAGNSGDASTELEKSGIQHEKEVASYRSSMETALRDNKLTIAKLNQEKPDLNEKSLEERSARIETLQKRNDALESRVNSYKSDSREEWKEFKKEFDSEVNDLRKAFKQL